ncbi:hypothetical protein Tco_0084118 [Tanacetum coccineum]
MVQKAVYDELSNRLSRFETRCISLEIKVQQSKESFQNDKPCNNQDSPEFQEFYEIIELKAQLQKKNTTINNLKDHIAPLKRKSVSDCTAPVNNSNVISPGMFNLDMPPLFPKFRKNKKARVDYLKQTKEHADTLRELVEHARTLKPLDNLLDYACKFTTRIQELLVRKSSTNASRSKPRSNTRNNRISRPSSSNKKNKNVEDHLMNLKSSLNKTNHVSVCNANIKNGVLNANFEFVCSTCNECLFSASHDMYVVDYLNDVNASDRAKSKRAKKNDWGIPTW